MRMILALICCLCSTAVMGQTMTLKECINTGIAENLAVLNAQIGIERGRTGVSQNRAGLLPVIQGVAQFTDYLKNPVNVTTGIQLGNDFPDSPTWQTIKSMQYNSNVGILLTMPIYNQSIFIAIDVARTIESIYSLSYEKAVEELSMQIAKVYYMAQASKEQLRLTDLNIKRIEELNAITEALYEHGLVMEIDLNRVRINTKLQKTEREITNTMFLQYLNMLRYLMNKDINEPLDVVAMPDTLKTDDTYQISYLLPEIRLADKQKELINRRIKSVRAGFLPTLSLIGYAGGVGYNEKLHQFTDNWFGNCYIGVTLRIPIFEANSKKLQIRQFQHKAQQADNNMLLLKKQVDKNFADAMQQMKRNTEIIRTQTQCLKQAEAVYNVTEEQYKEGVASMTSLLQDDMQLRSAQSAYIQALCQCKLAQLELLRLSHRLNQLTK